MTTRPLRILAVHRYYWPDTPPYASILRVIAERWSTSGHAVEVLSSSPSYKPELNLDAPARELVSGVIVNRIRMRSDRASTRRRLANTVRFCAWVTLRILFGPRRDVVMCSTAPPVVLAAVTSLAARVRGAKFVYHCMDIHPEIGAISGEFRKPVVYRALQRIDRATCRRASAIVVLSDDMACALQGRDPSKRLPIVTINNFDLPSFDSEPATQAPCLESEPRGGRLRIVFAGNLGRFQNLELIVSAVLDPSAPLDDVELVLMGEGAAKRDLEALQARHRETGSRVRLLPHGSIAAARALIRSGDLGLVTLVRGVISYAYPSKTAAYLSEGLPMLVAVEEDSSLARDVTSWGVGGAIPTSAKAEIQKSLLHWLERQSELAGMAERAREVWEQHFSAPALLPHWDRLLHDLAQGRTVS